MGDIRFVAPYQQVRDASNRVAAMEGMEDEALVAALAGAAKDGDPVLINVLATHAQNRVRRRATALDHMADAVVSLDRDGRVRDMNPAATQLLGWDLEEARHQPIHDLVHVQVPASIHPPEVQCAFARSLGTGSVRRSDDEVFARRSGTHFDASYTAAPILRDGEMEGSVLVIRDITEEKRTRSKLEELRLLNEQILHAAADGILLTDACGVIHFANPAAARILGWRMQDLIGRPAHETFHHTRQDGRPYPAETCPILLAIRDGRADAREDEVFWTKRGEAFPVEYAATPMHTERILTGAVIVFRDIRERKRHEKLLRESEARLRTVVTHAPVILTVVDCDGVVTFSEGRALGALGLERGSIGRSIFQEYGEYPEIVANLEAALRGEERSAVVSLRGSHFDIRWTPVCGRDGSVEEVLVVTVDITALKRSEEARLALQEREHQARLEAARAKLIVEHAARLDALSQASRAFAEAALDRDAALGRVAEAVVSIAGDACVIRLLSEDGSQLVPAALHHRDPERLEGLRQLFVAGPLPAREGVHARVVERREQVLVVVDSPAFRAAASPAQVDALRAFGVRSFLLVPLQLKDAVIGTLGFSREDDRPYSNEDRAFLQDLADRAALAVENARLHAAERAARLRAEAAARALQKLAEDSARLSASIVAGDAPP